MTDILNSFKAHLYERTVSPLVGSFIFYWLIFNYKLPVILLDSKLSSNEKFSQIESLYAENSISLFNGFSFTYDTTWTLGLVIPILLTLFYLLILPYATNFIHMLWISHQNELKKITNDKVLTKREFGELQRKFHELELSFDETFSKKDTEINQLKKRLDDKEHLHLESLNKIDEYKQNEVAGKTHTIENLELKEKLLDLNSQRNKNEQRYEKLTIENDNLKTSIRNQKNPIVKQNDYILPLEERLIMEYIGNNKNSDSHMISNAVNHDMIATEHFLDNLLSMEFIIQQTSEFDDEIYAITNLGRAQLMEIRKDEESKIPF